jgi:uncharacterized membrane protein
MVPISLVVTFVGAVIGGVVWLTTLHFSNEANAEKITEIQVVLENRDRKQEIMLDSINQIRQDVSEIKGEIKRIRK